MTYSGFKSYLYAGLSKDDPRVRAALGWMSEHYTLEENPGLGREGLYYYYVVFAKAHRALGRETMLVDGVERSWRADLVLALEKLQQPDGSFRSVADRWMENDRVLITAYALVALQEAR
jgi:squalene-hopene/tetraprenyl-beta-curcumene cyclase